MPLPWPIKVNVGKALLVLVEIHRFLGGVHRLMPHSAVVGDGVQLLQLMHQEYIRDAFREVSYLEIAIAPHLVGCNRSCIAIDLDSIGQCLDPLQILVCLECRDR